MGRSITRRNSARCSVSDTTRLRTVEDWTSRIHPDDLPSYRQAWRALFSGERRGSIASTAIAPTTGKWRWARQHGMALRDESGRVNRVVGATGDITELREAQELQAATAEVLRAISRADFDLDSVLRSLVTTAAQLTRADAAILWRYRDGAYHYAAGHLLAPEFESIERAAPIWPGEDTLVGRAALRQSTVQIVDAWTDPDYGPKDEARLGGIRSMLAVPLSREGVPIGMFTVGRPPSIRSPRRQISLVNSFADQAVIAIENARLFTELRSAPPSWRKRSNIRARPARSCASSTARRATRPRFSTPFSKRQRSFAMRAPVCCGCTTARFFAPPRCAICRRPMREFVTREPVKPGAETTLAQVIRDPRVRSRDDIRDAPSYYARDPLTVAAVELGGFRSMISIPLVKDGAALGVPVALSSGGQAVFRKAASLIEGFAAQAVIAMENARLFEESRRHAAGTRRVEPPDGTAAG